VWKRRFVRRVLVFGEGGRIGAGSGASRDQATMRGLVSHGVEVEKHVLAGLKLQ
jgi:hypothetical protein